MINIVVVIIFAAINNVDIMKTWLLLPLFIAELLIFAMALAFFLSALFVKYRDAGYIWEVLLQAAFYATPILYPLTIVAEKYQKIIMLNPVAQVIQDARWAFVSHDTLSSWQVLSPPVLFVPFGLVLLAVFIANRYFKKEAYYFAERI